MAYLAIAFAGLIDDKRKYSEHITIKPKKELGTIEWERNEFNIMQKQRINRVHPINSNVKKKVA